MDSSATPISHGTVVESITVDAPIEAVFAALSQAAVRSIWSKLPGNDRTYELDFRVGGSETRTSTFPNIGRDERLDVRTRFVEIRDNERVVSTFELRLDGVLRTTSLVTWELEPLGASTNVRYTELYFVLTPTGDGTADHRERKGATPMMLRGFKIAVEQQA